MGASSGFWPKGSEESHVLIRIPSGLGPKTGQIGCVRGSLGLFGFCRFGPRAVWADRAGDNASIVATAKVKRTNRTRKKKLLIVIPNEVRNLSLFKTQEKRDSSARGVPRFT